MKTIMFLSVYVLSIIGCILFYKIKIGKLKNSVLNNKTSNILKEVLKLGIKGQDLHRAAEKIVIVIRKYFKVNYCTVYIKRNDNLEMLSSNIEDTFIEGTNIKLLQQYINKLSNTLQYEAQIRNSKTVLSYPTAEARKIQYSYFIPLVINNETIGAIHIENKSMENMDKMQKEFFRIIIENITVVFQNMIYLEQLRLNGVVDGLTGVYNRKYMQEFLFRRSQEEKLFSIAMVDIDHFKKCNDTYGHQHGDKVLKEVSSFIKNRIKSLNEKNEIMRFGGEEFLIYIKDHNSQETFNILDGIRNELSEHVTLTDDGIKTNVTVSMGIAEFIKDSEEVQKLIEFADNALYEAKNMGRDRVNVYNNINI